MYEAWNKFHAFSFYHPSSSFLPPVFDLHGILILVLFGISSGFFGVLPVKPEQFPKDSRRNPERDPKQPAITPEEIVVKFIRNSNCETVLHVASIK
jgi:hypothetical protein